MRQFKAVDLRRMPQPAPFVLSLLIIAVTFGRVQAADASSASPMTCTTPAEIAAGLTLEARDTASVEATLLRDPAWEPDSLRVDTVTGVSGPCAGQVEGFLTSRLFLEGRAEVLNAQGDRLNIAGPFTSDLRPSKAAPHPALPEASFLGAAPVGYARVGGTLARHYVGLWRRQNLYLVAAYTQPEEGAATEPKLIFTSSAPLKSVSYFPSPDSPAGALGVVQVAEGGVRMIQFSWYHPKVFAPAS